MKKWLFILIFILAFALLGAAVSHAAGFWNYFTGANASASANSSGMYSPCPYTSTIPNYVQPQAYAPAPAYNPTPVYPGPSYNPTPAYTPTYTVPTYNTPTYPTPTYPTPTYPTPAYNPAPAPTYPAYNPSPAVNPYSYGYSNLVVYCPRGLQPNPSMNACVPVQIPPHAHLSIWGDTYDCDPGYNSLGEACVPSSYFGQYPY